MRVILIWHMALCNAVRHQHYGRNARSYYAITELNHGKVDLLKPAGGHRDDTLRDAAEHGEPKSDCVGVFLFPV